MERARDVVITGMGVVSPIGIGPSAFWGSLVERRSGVRSLNWFGDQDLPAPMGADVPDFVPAQWIRQRKALKVMSRVIQLGVAAADMASTEAKLSSAGFDPDRIGVIFGADMIAADLFELADGYRACTDGDKFDFGLWGHQALAAMYPLWMLKYLPNMPACHVGIFQDARGPNNTHTMGDTSGLTAMAEAADVIRRGLADAVIAGATSSRLHPSIYLGNRSRQFARRRDDPATACRPFDADRDGMVFGEGSAAFVLETRDRARARGAKCLARILGSATAFEPPPCGGGVGAMATSSWAYERHGHENVAIPPMRGSAIRRAIRSALARSGLAPSEIGHVNAHGLSTTLDDRIEAQAIRDTLADVPVTAPKSYFGNLAAAGGMAEMAATILAFQHGLIPPVLNYRRPDPECPIRVIAGEPMPLGRPTAMVLNHSHTGQAVAMVVAAPD